MVARIVEVPVPRFDPITCGHVGEQGRTGIRRQNVKSGRGDSNLDGPVYSAGKDVAVISVQAEDEAAVDHDAEAVESADHFAVVPAEVLPLPCALEAPARKRLESHEQTSQTGGGRLFHQIIAQNPVGNPGSPQ